MALGIKSELRNSASEALPGLFLPSSPASSCLTFNPHWAGTSTVSFSSQNGSKSLLPPDFGTRFSFPQNSLDPTFHVTDICILHVSILAFLSQGILFRSSSLRQVFLIIFSQSPWPYFIAICTFKKVYTYLFPFNHLSHPLGCKLYEGKDYVYLDLRYVPGVVLIKYFLMILRS